MADEVGVGFHLPQQLRSITSHVVEVDLAGDQGAFRIDDECTAEGQAAAAVVDTEDLGNHPCWIGGQRVLDVGQKFLGMTPSQMRELGVGGHAIHIAAKVFQLGMDHC